MVSKNDIPDGEETTGSGIFTRAELDQLKPDLPASEGSFYCRVYDGSHNELICRGGYSTYDECWGLCEKINGGEAISLTYKPCD